jgi:hypothetical protein
VDGVQKKDSSLLRRLADPLRMTVFCEARGEENSGAAAILFPSLYPPANAVIPNEVRNLYILIQHLDINVIPNEVRNFLFNWISSIFFPGYPSGLQ